MKKMVLGRKTNFFLGKTKKHILWDTTRPKSKLMVFPRKKLIFHAETIFSLEKNWFFCSKPFFPRKKMVLVWKTNFPKDKDGFGIQNQLFPRKKMVLA